MSTQMQQHLRKYIEDGIQQKIRLNNLITYYKNQEHKTRERIIDENDLERKLTADGIDSQRINLVIERRKRDEAILEKVQRVINQAQEDMDGLTLRMNVHLEELTDIEIGIGGFIAHSIGIDKGASLDKENMVVKFKPNGHVEIPIAARMNKWKDSSQLTIKKIQKAGV
jgi:hypothetical protein